jgi:KipI family sensor histidine kinase inhibitor
MLRRHLIERALPGVIDLVPAYASLLIKFDPDLTSHTKLAEKALYLLGNVSARDPSEPQDYKTHIVPVEYGGDAGPDFDEVARLREISGVELIKLHTSRSYRVNFLGFLPGFAYLSKLHRKLTTPRLPTPRTRVEAGSVGIAGGQTAVYPFTSPGGWRIIGRTSLPVWDPLAAEAARFAPGDSVRFTQSAYEPPTQLPSLHTPTPAQPLFEVLAAPGLTTVQDLGRPGFAHLGVGQGGVFDGPAAVRANALVGNEPGKAVLEMTWNGPQAVALRNATIALDGADLECRVDGAPIPPGLSWFVRRGSTLRFSRAHPGRGGVRGYLAVAGGIDVPPVLGARSTSLPRCRKVILC